jgi:hypothetical protein
MGRRGVRPSQHGGARTSPQTALELAEVLYAGASPILRRVGQVVRKLMRGVIAGAATSDRARRARPVNQANWPRQEYTGSLRVRPISLIFYV